MTNPVFTRFPSGILIKGGNLTARYSDVAVMPMGTATFGGPFGAASQTFDINWFTTQMDVAVAVGCNTVQITGDLEQRIAGGITEPNYLNRWNTVITAAASRNLYVICRGASSYQLTGVVDGSNVITLEARNLLNGWFDSIRLHTNVIAVDILSESSAWVLGVQGTNPYNGELRQAPITAPQLLAVQQTVYTDFKAIFPDLPITFGGCQNDFRSAAGLTSANLWYQALSYMDYVDFHIYYDIAVKDIIPAMQLINGKPIVIGEFGLRTASSAPYDWPGCNYDVMHRFLFNSGVDGSVLWSLVDAIGEIHPSQDWGIADDGGSPLRTKGNTYSTFSTIAEKKVSIFAGGMGGRLQLQ